MRVTQSISVIFTVLVFASLAIAQGRLRLVDAALAQQRTASKEEPTYIRPGSRVYVTDIDGLPAFEHNLVAAFQKKKVDLLVVTDRSQAEFEVQGFAQTETAGWAKTIFGSGRPLSEASIQLVNLKTGVVAYAVASYKVDAWNGNKSTAEHLAKNLRQKMERDDKRLRKQ